MSSKRFAPWALLSVFLAADIGKQDEVEQLAAAAVNQFGGVDILVNNAGLNTPGPLRRKIHEYDAAEWRRVLGVDLDGVFYCSRAIAPGMVERKSGVIVNIASVMGIVPARLQSAFVSAKAAVINLSRSMALELAPLGIRVNAIAPDDTRAARGHVLQRGEQATARAF